jgi:lipopolysaccharide biosynthesis glycosyltransferase
VIACAADDRYVQHLAVMLKSVIANLGSDRLLEVHILHGGINERNPD